MVIGGGIAAVLLVIFIIIYSIYRALHPRKIEISAETAKLPSIERITRGNLNAFDYSGETDAFIACMYDSNVSDDVFVTFFGYEDITVTRRMPSIRVLGSRMEDIFEDISEEEFPRYIVLGIDPYAGLLQSCSNSDLYRKQIAFIRDIAVSHPACRILITLPDDSAAKWASLDETKVRQARNSYIATVRELSDIENIRILYNPIEDWVLYSDCIREDGPLSPVLYNLDSHMLATNIDPNAADHVLTADNVNTIMDETIERARRYEDIRSSYADLSGKDVYFIGDSIFGNFRDETAVSSFFRDMTGAQVYNLGEGGMAAVSAANSSSDIGSALNYLLGKERLETFSTRCYDFKSYYSYWNAADRLKETKGENSIFIVEFGLNDYFTGKSADEFRSAMNRIITELKSTYPKAEILVLSPGFIRMYNDGTTLISETGSVLQAYRDITTEVAVQQNCELLSLTDDFGFTQEETASFLLPDLVHYNENGRYLLAQGLARYFKK
ncbi:MAG: SGNH/GDSL hydrolase family protein [Lachnospiraceae bacterium]|nr:SGNH/GDSL hydrolase family protein [Lachnospiraceae bacterium]